ncbi:helix-turn-helix domain-containing protein [Paraglaciecola sp.]|uniref:helix-turn-helix domain-containing protein n=1 Tax=Paraglaciecola sp. TaxID=1920173 RepID=UPI003EF83478
MSGTQIELLKVWYIFSFSLGVWTCLNLTVAQQVKTMIKLTMVSYILVLLVSPVNGYLAIMNDQPIQWLNRISQNLTWAYGPLLYFLVKQGVLKQVTKGELVLHLTPLILVNVLRLLPVLAEYNWLLLTLLFIQIFTYASYTVYLLSQHKTRLKNLFTGHQNTLYFWMMFFAIGLLITTLVDIIILSAFNLGLTPDINLVTTLACLISIYVNSIALCSVFRPQFFTTANEVNDVQREPPSQKLRNVELSPEAAADLQSKLDCLVQEFQPHMDDDISLPKLASLLGVTRNQLSELFNLHMSISFYDFLNELRYQESLKLLNQISHKYSIADVAYQAGFNNRNTFYKVFKEKSGVTPTQYKKLN